MCAKKTIKGDILEKARELFNRDSWAEVSLRKIAADLGVSDGNLRYHYRTKEEIVLQLFSAMTEEMALVIFEAEKELDQLSSNFKAMFRIMYKFRFLFLESYFIKQSYPSYAILFGQLQDSRQALFIDEFNRLKAEGQLSSAFSDQQYEMLFEQLFIISDSWLKYLLPEDSEQVEERIEHYAQLCYALLIPYMSSPSAAAE